MRSRLHCKSARIVSHKSICVAGRHECLLRLSYRDIVWLRLVGSLQLQVSFAKEPYKRDYIMQRPIISRSLLLAVCGSQHWFLCEILAHESMCYNTLRHTATHCNTLRHTATHSVRYWRMSQCAVTFVRNISYLSAPHATFVFS